MDGNKEKGLRCIVNVGEKKSFSKVMIVQRRKREGKKKQKK